MTVTEIDAKARQELLDGINGVLSRAQFDTSIVASITYGGAFVHKLPVKNGCYVSLRLWRANYRLLNLQAVVRPWSVVPLMRDMELAILKDGQEVGRKAFSVSSGEATLACRPSVLPQAQFLFREIEERS